MDADAEDGDMGRCGAGARVVDAAAGDVGDPRVLASVATSVGDGGVSKEQAAIAGLRQATPDCDEVGWQLVSLAT